MRCRAPTAAEYSGWLGGTARIVKSQTQKVEVIRVDQVLIFVEHGLQFLHGLGRRSRGLRDVGGPDGKSPFEGRHAEFQEMNGRFADIRLINLPRDVISVFAFIIAHFRGRLRLRENKPVSLCRARLKESPRGQALDVGQQFLAVIGVAVRLFLPGFPQGVAVGHARTKGGNGNRVRPGMPGQLLGGIDDLGVLVSHQIRGGP